MTTTNAFRGSLSGRAFLSQFETFLRNQIRYLSILPFKGHRILRDSIEHSLFSGGKHFRPLLVQATALWVGVRTRLILPWAGAIEMAHVASLIHDDLPCMDNSLQRRGQPANHRLFGEDIALLAGNSLWIEAFRLILRETPKAQAHLWLPILSDALSFNGLMGGQALDLKPSLDPDLNYYKQMHLMKTGQLISACMEGVAVLPFVDKQKQEVVQTVAPLIGRAFQIADDLQDESEEKTPSNFAHVIGCDKAKKLLFELSDKALSLLDAQDRRHSVTKRTHSQAKDLGSGPALPCSETSSMAFLKELILFNKNRVS